MDDENQNDLDIPEVNDVLRGLVESRETFEICREGKPVAVMMSYDEYIYLLSQTGRRD